VKLLLDAGIPWQTVNLLAQSGHDAVHANLIMLGASDAALLDLAIEQGRVIVTLDADFHALLAERGAVQPSVIRLRLQYLRHEEAAALINKIIGRCSQELEAGAVVSANRVKIRIKKLPLP
jgi:predicted nuclease of predicted toxin-antitoxin system